MVWIFQPLFHRSLLAFLLMAVRYRVVTDATPMTQSPGTKTYLDDIFNQYGDNGTSITPENFQIFLRHLSLGGVVLEKLDKNCLYKGVHVGITTEPSKKDGLSKGTGSNKQLDRSVGQLSRKRRSEEHGHEKPTSENPLHAKHLQRHYKQCLSKQQILELHRLDENVSISRESFLRLCPALISQINDGYCIHRHNCSEKPWYISTEISSKMVWVYGFVAVTVVSLASLCIIAVIPCLERGFYQRVMGYLVALAVGTLAGDALLHLIPHAFESLLGGTKSDHKKNIWKSCFILLGIYGFFLVEQLVKIKSFFQNKKSQKRRRKSSTKSGAPTARDLDTLEYKMAASSENEKNARPESTEFCVRDTEPQSPDTLSETELIEFSSEKDGSNHHNHDPHNHLEKHDHHKVPHDLEHNHGHSHGAVDKNTSIASVAWMVIVGDGFHNFSDGLAIGAAFAASYTSGISTAIAVFCHELPHELGDFAVLIKSGMSIKQAIFYNLVSAVLSFIGLVIGVLVGNYSVDGKQYALALTAGLFLYVALANMLPELTSSVEDDVGDLWSFIAPHLGILSGFVIMLLISVYEDKF